VTRVSLTSGVAWPACTHSNCAASVSNEIAIAIR
jgi:hypothetical protein